MLTKLLGAMVARPLAESRTAFITEVAGSCSWSRKASSYIPGLCPGKGDWVGKVVDWVLPVT